MSKKSKLLLLAAFPIAIGFAACKNDTATQAGAETPQMVGEPAPPPTGGTPLEQIKATALQESDIIGRVERSLMNVQKEFNDSEGKVPGQGKITLFVDAKFTFLLKNEVDGDVFESKVNLKDLNVAEGGMQLIADKTADEKPGVRIPVQEGKPKVEITKNGKVLKESNELVFYMATRENIQRMLPSLLQAIQTAQGKI